MSNTYKTKNYFQALRAFREGKEHKGISSFWDFHRFRFRKTPRDSKTAKEIIQKAGHRKRRTKELEACRLALYSQHEDVDYDLYLPKNAKKHSSIWDYD